MGRLLNVVNQLHRRTARDYVGRMTDDKVHCSVVARRFDRDYWDGDRRYGYGGYRYDGRWSVVAKQLVETYSLPANAKILDVGCGRGFLLYEFTRLLPNCTVVGFDVSEYGIATATTVRVTPVPPAPEVPTDATVTCSVLVPMSSRIGSPAVMLLVEVTLRVVVPAGAAAASRAWIPGVPTAVTVACSNRRP